MDQMTSVTRCVLVLIGGAISLFGCASQVSPSGESSAQTDLVVTPAELVFDRVPFRGSAEKKLKLENNSTYVIRLYDAHWQCGCMFMRFQPCELKPGESKEFTVVMRGDSTPAALKGGDLLINTNSATNATVRVQVRAKDVYGVTCVPETIDFGRPEYGKLPITLPLKIVVNGLTDAQTNTIKVQSSHPLISTGPLSRNKAGDYLVDVMLHGRETTGNILGTLKVSGDGFDDLNVSAFAVIRHAVFAHPPTLMINGSDPAEIVLRNENGSPVPIDDVVVSAPLRDSVQCVPGDNQRYLIKAVDTKTGSKGNQQGLIEFHAKDKAGKIIAVSVPVIIFGSGP